LADFLLNAVRRLSIDNNALLRNQQARIGQRKLTVLTDKAIESAIGKLHKTPFLTLKSTQQQSQHVYIK